MITVFLKRLLYAALVVLIQVLLLDKINILGYATPYLFVFFILTLDTGLSPIKKMTWGFVLGLIVDMFSNTMGMHAAATTLLAFAQPSLLRLFFVYDKRDNVNPSLSYIGARQYLLYIFTGTLLHHFIFYILKTFSFADVLSLLMCILLSTVLSFLLMLVVELVFRRDKYARKRR